MNKATLLVVDDEEIVREQIKDTFCSQYEVVEAADFSEVVEILESASDFRLAFIDYRLRSRNGIDVLNALREKKPELPAIIMTGYSLSENVMVEAIRAGITDYLRKPISPKYLLERVAEILKSEESTYQLDMPSIIKYIEANYMDENLTLETAAAAWGVRKETLCRLFSKDGGTFTTCLNDIRIRNAAKLLIRDLTISEVAFAVGYRSLRHFNNNFKERAGITPTEYRNKIGFSLNWSQLDMFDKSGKALPSGMEKGDSESPVPAYVYAISGFEGRLDRLKRA